MLKHLSPYVGNNPNRAGGAVHFTRFDGVATVQVDASLTADAALKLEELLRDLVVEDAPALAAEAEALAEQQRVERAQFLDRRGYGEALGAVLDGVRPPGLPRGDC